MRRRTLSGAAVALTALVAACLAVPPMAWADDAADQDASSTASRSAVRPAVLGSPVEGDDHGIAVSIDDLAPRVLTTEDHLTVSGTLTNTSGADLADPELDVYVRTSTPVTSDELTAFLSGGQWAGRPVAMAALGRDLPAGATESFSLTVNTADLPLGDAFDWGPRGLTVAASSASAGGEDRTLLVWDSGYDASPTIIDALVPWTSDTASAGGSAATERETLLSLAGMAGVTLAVDPALLTADEGAAGSSDAGSSTTSQSGAESSAGATAQSGTRPSASPAASASEPAEPSSSPSPRGGTASREAQALRAFTADLLRTAPEIVALPRGDTDLGTLTICGATRLLDLAADSRSDVAAASAAVGGTATIADDVVWPTSSTFGLQVLQQFADQTVIAPPGALSPVEQLPFTSVSRVEVDPQSGATSTAGQADGTVTVLTSQQAISDVLSWDPSLASDRLDAQQALIALSAIITREKPNDSRTLLALVPRGTPVDDGLRERLTALLDQRWVSGVAFSALAGSAPTDQDRQPVTAAADADASTQDAFQAVTEALDQADALSSALADPAALTSSLEEAALAMMSAGTTDEERAAQAARLRLRAARLMSSVHVEPTSTINLINKTADFPVPLTNDLDWDVTVRVSLTPSDPRLRVTDIPEVTIPAGTSTTVEVPVSAIGSGDIMVGYRVTTPDGHVLDDTQSVTVRMRAGWEDTGTAAIAGLLVLALVLGVARTVRRRRRSRRASAATGIPPAPPEALPGAVEEPSDNEPAGPRSATGRPADAEQHTDMEEGR